MPSACQQSASGHCSKSWTLSTGPTPTTWSEITHLEQRLGWQSSSRWWKEVLGSILQSPQQIGSCVAGLWVWASIGWKQRCLSEGATRQRDRGCPRVEFWATWSGFSVGPAVGRGEWGLPEPPLQLNDSMKPWFISKYYFPGKVFWSALVLTPPGFLQKKLPQIQRDFLRFEGTASNLWAILLLNSDNILIKLSLG